MAVVLDGSRNDTYQASDRASERLRLQPASAECNSLAGLHFMTKAQSVVVVLLDEEIIRVCANCQQEFGQVPRPAHGVDSPQVSHGICKRHAAAQYLEMADFARERGENSEAVEHEAMARQIEQMPDDKFAPDLSAQDKRL